MKTGISLKQTLRSTIGRIRGLFHLKMVWVRGKVFLCCLEHLHLWCRSKISKEALIEHITDFSSAYRRVYPLIHIRLDKILQRRANLGRSHGWLGYPSGFWFQNIMLCQNKSLCSPYCILPMHLRLTIDIGLYRGRCSDSASPPREHWSRDRSRGPDIPIESPMPNRPWFPRSPQAGSNLLILHFHGIIQIHDITLFRN